MIVYLNGQYISRENATVSVEDRGFMFADGVYEVVRFYNGHALAMRRHLDRLRHSLDAVRIDLPDDVAFDAISAELVRRNKTPDASVYWQVTRGAAPRHHRFPDPPVSPTTLAIAYPAPPFERDAPVRTLKAITRPDVRWRRCAIKSVSLLPNILDSQAAADVGCDEAILIRDGVVTEGTARSVFIAEAGVLYTHPLTDDILDSITRRIVVELAMREGLTVVEEQFPIERLMNADEVIALGTTTEVASIIEVDGHPVGGGAAGRIAQRLFTLFRDFIVEACDIA
ncbi:MAG: D-amino acid aminotransferase [Phycisphaera sp.]|nr:D-amino acid aminotransferase [Phycisphaera sp.]